MFNPCVLLLEVNKHVILLFASFLFVHRAMAIIVRFIMMNRLDKDGKV